MATKRQITANRANAAPPDPALPEGKQRVRLNGFRHRLTGHTSRHGRARAEVQLRRQRVDIGVGSGETLTALIPSLATLSIYERNAGKNTGGRTSVPQEGRQAGDDIRPDSDAVLRPEDVTASEHLSNDEIGFAFSIAASTAAVAAGT